MKRVIIVAVFLLAAIFANAQQGYIYQIESPEVIQLLLDAGCDMDDLYYSYTNAWEALLRINAPLPFYERLIELGKSVEPEFGNGIFESPLVMAIERNNYEVVNFLISKGADVNRKHRVNSTPLHFAAGKEDTRILRRLIEAGATVNRESGYLHRAAFIKENIELLLAHGANINAVTEDGFTPLMFSAGFNVSKLDAVQAMLQGKPNINAVNKDGKSALILAAENGRDPSIITLLLNAGADARLEDNTGRTALDWLDLNRHLNRSTVRKELKDRM